MRQGYDTNMDSSGHTSMASWSDSDSKDSVQEAEFFTVLKFD